MRRENEEVVAIKRGIEAGQVLENPAYIEALESLRADVIAAWKACPIRDVQGQMLYLQLAKMSDKFDRILHDYVEAGRYLELQRDVNDLRDENGLRRVIRKVI